jgi:23S rRNA (uracil1939-C5)-methyltransferase
LRAARRWWRARARTWPSTKACGKSQGRALCAPTQFAARNLFEMTPAVLAADGAADKWLVDPPREGAFELFKALAALHPHGAGARG